MNTLTNKLKIVAFTVVWSGLTIAGAMATTYPVIANAQAVVSK